MWGGAFSIARVPAFADPSVGGVIIAKTLLVDFIALHQCSDGLARLDYRRVQFEFQHVLSANREFTFEYALSCVT
jgi:hypothetical protein